MQRKISSIDHLKIKIHISDLTRYQTKSYFRFFSINYIKFILKIDINCLKCLKFLTVLNAKI
jgi:hypothetical protein